MRKTLIALGLFFISQNIISQDNSIYNLIVKPGAESTEIWDIMQFNKMSYVKFIVSGNDLPEKFYLITTSEYWDKVLVKKDTIINTKNIGFKNDTDQLEFRVLSQKIANDTVKFMLFQPRLATIKEFKTKHDNTYSLRDPSNGKNVVFGLNERIATLSYSLPYEDPNKPGHLFYCVLSTEGIHPSEWGLKYGVQHYIIFEFEIIE
jgi:hypothetical protein